MSSSLIPYHHPLAFASIISFSIVLVAITLYPTWLSSLSSLPIPFLHGYTAPVVINSHTGVSYRGIAVNGVEHFQNIYYAEDTSGLNRFAPPVPFTPPRGAVLDATAAGARCPQGTGGPPLPFASPIGNISENCLSLRIARPSGISASAKLPVLVWIHGGILSQRLAIEEYPLTDDQSNGWQYVWRCIRPALSTRWSDTANKVERPAGDLCWNKLPLGMYVGCSIFLSSFNVDHTIVFGFAAGEALKSVKNTNAGLRDQRAAFECEYLTFTGNSAC